LRIKEVIQLALDPIEPILHAAKRELRILPLLDKHRGHTVELPINRIESLIHRTKSLIHRRRQRIDLLLEDPRAPWVRIHISGCFASLPSSETLELVHETCPASMPSDRAEFS
jgi:hypothetical protein